VEALWGWLHFDDRCSVERAELANIASIIGASAPDIRVDRNFALAMSRKIVDPAAQASSIFQLPDGSLWVAMNGEIDNRKELLRDLENRGRNLVSGLDAEIVLRLYEESGTRCARQIDGLFNIAIWSPTARRLTLICDKLGGVKSLYYYRDSTRFAFGTTVKAIIAHPQVERAVDSAILPELFLVGHPIAPDTLMRNIKVLTAGSYLECQSKRMTTGHYWRRNFRPADRASRDEIERRYFNALVHAVRRVTDTTAELGVMVSGGVDSAALVSLMRQAGAGRIRTFSIHIGDLATNDRAASQRVADLYATERCSIDHLDANCLNILPEMIWHFESAGQDFHPTYWLCRQAAPEIEILVGGYGNDLVWGCFPLPRTGRWRRMFAFADVERRFLEMRRRLPLQYVRRLLPSSPQSEWAVINKLSRFASHTGHAVNDQIALDDAMFGEQVVHRELGKFMVDAHSIWPRMPYLDARLGAIADSVAPNAKMAVDAAGRVEFKHFFKEVMRKNAVLPNEIIFRKKTWMTSPMAEWLREGLGKVVEAILLAAHARERGYFNPHEIERLIHEHRAGIADHMFCLMMLTGFELWHRIFIDAPMLRKPEVTLPQVARGDVV
jgi:asparagine synthase (glutamine-hydrolysing)